MSNTLLETISTLLGGFFLFLFGAVIGSFLHVMATRGAEGKLWVTGRSACDHCHKLLKWFDMVPVLSFLFLKGTCRFCKKPITQTHLVSEIAFGAVFLIWFALVAMGVLSFSNLLLTITALYWLIVFLTLTYITLVDLKYLIIPDGSIILLTILTLLYQVTTYGLGAPATNFIATIAITLGLTTGMFLLWAGTKGKGLGFGDVKLMIPLGLVAGWPQALVGLFLAFLIGAVVGVFLIASKKRQWRQPIPFGPFLIVGFLLSMTHGLVLWEWYLQLLR